MVSTEEKLDAALDLLRRLPPSRIFTYLQGLIELAPELAEDLLSSVDQPLEVATDTKASKDYLLCDYNRDGDSYRSPWSNTYDPPLEDGVLPGDDLRKTEVAGNELFRQYCRSYYDEDGLSSCYLWDQEEGGGIAGAVLFKKECGKGSGKPAQMDKGVWDAVHVVEAGPESEGAGPSSQSAYHLTSTVMLSAARKGAFKLEGSLTRRASKDMKAADGHMANMGALMEETEGRMRMALQQVYFGKCFQVISALRSAEGDGGTGAKRSILVEDLKSKASLGGKAE